MLKRERIKCDTKRRKINSRRKTSSSRRKTSRRKKTRRRKTSRRKTVRSRKTSRSRKTRRSRRSRRTGTRRSRRTGTRRSRKTRSRSRKTRSRSRSRKTRIIKKSRKSRRIKTRRGANRSLEPCIGKQIGCGEQGIVYDYTLDKVIKCCNVPVNEKIMNLASIKNIGPKYFGVFKTASEVMSCYIQEKLYPFDMGKLESGWYDKELCKLITELINNGIFHNDIKFDNIMLTKDGKLRLIDFDLATEISDYGFIKFDNSLEMNMEIELENGNLKQLKFTTEQMDSILKMRPLIRKALREIENEEMLKKAREEARLLAQQERIKKYNKILS
jgi:hypothetical protein